MMRGLKNKRSSCSDLASSLSDITLRSRTVSRNSIPELSQSVSAIDSHSGTSLSVASEKIFARPRSFSARHRRAKQQTYTEKEKIRKTRKRVSTNVGKNKMDKKMVNTIVLAPFHALKQCFQTKLRDLYLSSGSSQLRKKIAIPTQRKHSPLLEYNVIELRPVQKNIKKERDATEKIDIQRKLKRRRSESSADAESSYCQCTNDPEFCHGRSLTYRHRHGKQSAYRTIKCRIKPHKYEKKKIKFQNKHSGGPRKVYHLETPGPSQMVSRKKGQKQFTKRFHCNGNPIELTIEETDETEIPEKKWRATFDNAQELFDLASSNLRIPHYKTRSVTQKECHRRAAIDFEECNGICPKNLRKRMEGSKEKILLGTKPDHNKNSDTIIKDFHDREPVAKPMTGPEQSNKTKITKEDMLLTGGVGTVPAINKEPPELLISENRLSPVSEDLIPGNVGKQFTQISDSCENNKSDEIPKEEYQSEQSIYSNLIIGINGRDETNNFLRSTNLLSKSLSREKFKEIHCSRSLSFPRQSKSSNTPDMESQALNITVNMTSNSDGTAISEVTKLFDSLLSSRSNNIQGNNISANVTQALDSWLINPTRTILPLREHLRSDIANPKTALNLIEAYEKIEPFDLPSDALEIKHEHSNEAIQQTDPVEEEEWKNIEPCVIIREHFEKASSDEADVIPETAERFVQVSVESSSMFIPGINDQIAVDPPGVSQTAILAEEMKIPKEVHTKTLTKNCQNDIEVPNDKAPSYIFGPRNAFSKLRESCEFPFGISRIMSDDDDSDNGDYFEFKGNR